MTGLRRKRQSNGDGVRCDMLRLYMTGGLCSLLLHSPTHLPVYSLTPPLPHLPASR